MNNSLNLFLLFFIGISFFSCSMMDSQNSTKVLPILGEREFVNGDTVYHKIPSFQFINQDSIIVTEKTFDNKAYIVDYFFTSCPTICPKVKAQTLRIEERFKTEDRLNFLSVSIDTKYDKVPKLKSFSEKLDVDTKKWHFVTGEKEFIYDIAESFFHIAVENPDAPGGYDHDGRLILVDKNKHIRAFCDGTDPESVDKFMDNIEILLNEK